jgi:hypothetical protein
MTWIYSLLKFLVYPGTIKVLGFLGLKLLEWFFTPSANEEETTD